MTAQPHRPVTRRSSPLGKRRITTWCGRSWRRCSASLSLGSLRSSSPPGKRIVDAGSIRRGAGGRRQRQEVGDLVGHHLGCRSRRLPDHRGGDGEFEQFERGDACRDVLSPGSAHGDPPRVGAAAVWVRPLLVAASTTLVCAAIWVGDPTTPHGPLPVCPTKALLGIDCPGCGSMRMLYSLMHGNLLAAARFNALGVVAVVLLVWAYLAWTYGRVTGRRIRELATPVAGLRG